ncbi:hypothetical protein BGZ57DRAFT_936032 [Hyaloscypha finlandica]|nr:hypothetical protein BGZ57DRAFT_936032 [Hyaloscypha finlandica]
MAFNYLPIEERLHSISRPNDLFRLGSSKDDSTRALYSQPSLYTNPESQVLAHLYQDHPTYPQQPFTSTPSTSIHQPPSLSRPTNALPSRIQKRKVNTLAARRYRQKRVDQMSDLEAKLKEIRAERDALKMKAARLEGEVEVLGVLVGR